MNFVLQINNKCIKGQFIAKIGPVVKSHCVNM